MNRLEELYQFTIESDWRLVLGFAYRRMRTVAHSKCLSSPRDRSTPPTRIRTFTNFRRIVWISIPMTIITRIAYNNNNNIVFDIRYENHYTVCYRALSRSSYSRVPVIRTCYIISSLADQYTQSVLPCPCRTFSDGRFRLHSRQSVFCLSNVQKRSNGTRFGLGQRVTRDVTVSRVYRVILGTPKYVLRDDEGGQIYLCTKRIIAVFPARHFESEKKCVYVFICALFL